MIGKRFGRLVVTQRIDDYRSPSGGTHKRYECVCDCGSTSYVLSEHLTSGRQKSCGCLRSEPKEKKHGMIHTRLYRIWGNMCNRCSNENNPAWDRYGARGITVCGEWKDFRNFMDWALENGYSDDLTIDRIDNDLGYCPENCRWVDCFVQANNKRNNRIIEYKGDTRTLKEWSDIIGVPYKSLHHRIVGLGWDIEKAFERPLRKFSASYGCAKHD